MSDTGLQLAACQFQTRTRDQRLQRAGLELATCRAGKHIARWPLESSVCKTCLEDPAHPHGEGVLARVQVSHLTLSSVQGLPGSELTFDTDWARPSLAQGDRRRFQILTRGGTGVPRELCLGTFACSHSAHALSSCKDGDCSRGELGDALWLLYESSTELSRSSSSLTLVLLHASRSTQQHRWASLSSAQQHLKLLGH